MFLLSFWIISTSTVFKIVLSEQSHAIIFPKDKFSLQLNSECETTERTLGTCKRMHDCLPERVKLNTKDICYFEENLPVVCCERDTSEFPSRIEVSTTFSPKNVHYVTISPFYGESIYNLRIQTSNRISNKECVKYISINTPNPAITMPRKDIIPMLAGGNLSVFGQNPEIAAIGWRSFLGKIDWKCGGSLISLNFVLTAAHCTSDRGQPAEIVRAGDLNLLEDDDMSQDFNVTEIFNHPSYTNDTVYNDIALIKITPNAVINFFVKPACIWTEPDIPVEKLVVMGYGRVGFGKRQSNILYEGDLTFVSNEECRTAYGNRAMIPTGIINTQFCAKDPRGITDTCQGDSGGPLFFKIKSPNFTSHHIVGITSYGSGCLDSKPGVYTKISSYIDWIESIVWPNGN